MHSLYSIKSPQSTLKAKVFCWIFITICVILVQFLISFWELKRALVILNLTPWIFFLLKMCLNQLDSFSSAVFSILFNADTIIASLLKTIYHGIVLSCFSKFNNFLWDSCCSSVMSIRYQCFILQGDKGCMEGDMFFYYKSNAILKILCHIICPHVFLISFLFFYNVTFLFYVYYIVSTHSHKCRD